MSIAIELNTDYGVNRIAYGNDRAMAEEQLSLIRPKLRGRFSTRNGDDHDSHTIKSPAGDVVVVLDRISVIRIVDYALHAELTADDDERAIKIQAKLELAKEACRNKNAPE